jgi:hypothetical protein
MAPAMIFMSEDWKYKLTQAQCDKLKELKIRDKAQSQSNTHNSTPNSSYNANSTQSQPSQSPPPALAAPVPGNSLHQMLSNSHSRPTSQVNTIQCTYSIHRIDVQSSGAFIDGGANGGLGGTDVRVMGEACCTADVAGIGAKSVTNLPICTVGAVIQTQKGPIIGVFNQYAHYGKGQTVHSVNQHKLLALLLMTLHVSSFMESNV